MLGNSPVQESSKGSEVVLAMMAPIQAKTQQDKIPIRVILKGKYIL
jgi:hypothetical protein